MNHLEEAKARARFSNSADGAEWAQYNAQLAIAYALIAICERMDRATKQEAQVSQESQDATGWVDIDDNLL